ncbi:MAG: MBL fold metallo-hydrolase [Alkalibacterium sp.]|nr:MBL fold metallo-hydrolase [Alkalibacterium sp.]TVP92345.1 MAG: MBL fold metallo-hydrolase [Alkalibacterium sp.]
MELIVLGCYGGYPTDDTGTSAYLLKSGHFNLLLDAGSYSLLTLEKHVDPLELDAVLLSHYHHDHIADLGVLQFTRLLKRDKNGNRAHLLPIYCHDEDEQRYQEMTLENVSEGIAYNHDKKIAIGPFDVYHMKTLHPVPCYAFKIIERESGKCLVFTADSGYMEKFSEFAEGADCLLADSNFYRGMENHSVHMTAKECGVIAEKAGINQLILTHLPQTGNHADLVEQAEEYAPETKVKLAEKNKNYII